MTRIFSGVQPTGNLHIGNYFGAIKQWVARQHEADALFCIVDYHAITVPQAPEALRHATLETAATYIACGIDPAKAALFHQSAVPEHTELAWLLMCHTPLGWLNRMTQFKEKAGKKKEQAVLGLYAYPVLMAADILLYNTTHVPVGEDQTQHLELARDIAGAFNRHYDTEHFILPEAVLHNTATRVMSLRDGTKKMSKSDPSDYSRIHLTDDADTIALKLRKAKSDMHEGISYEPETRPEVANLLTLFAAATERTPLQVADEYASSSFSDFKQALADAMVAHIAPISTEINRLMQDKAALEAIMQQGATHARTLAQDTIARTKQIIGFVG